MQPTADTIWTSAQEHLRSMLSTDTYNLWFAPLRACAQEENHLVLEVANDFCEVWLKDNYMGLLRDVVAVASGRQLQIKFKVGSTEQSLSMPAQPELPAQAVAAKPRVVEAVPTEKNSSHNEPGFNPKNTFDTFVVGNNNNFAYAAALAVAQAPGKSYNPLFLYGGGGLGQTPLLRALGQDVPGQQKRGRGACFSSHRIPQPDLYWVYRKQPAR